MSARKRRALRRVAVVTGTRAEYGLLRSPMKAISAHPSLELQLVVTGMHLLRKFGATVSEIVRDGWRIDARVKMQRGDDSPRDQAEGLARGVSGMARFFERAQTDIVVVLGDRIEAMAGALAGVTTGRVVAHVHGGDVAPGDFDESLRHAITKLAHVHLAASRDAADRIRRMGESGERVHVVGAPGLDAVFDVVRTIGRSRRPTGRALVVQHPCGRSAAHEKRVMNALLRAVDDKGLAPTIIYPNSDRGHAGIIVAIEARSRRRNAPPVTVCRSLAHDAYLDLLVRSDVLIGNSSSGIIEAPAAGTPSVNIGLRQAGRLRGGPSVVDAGESYAAIRRALAKALRPRPIRARSRVYGRGGAGQRIAAVLAKCPQSAVFRQKSGSP